MADAAYGLWPLVILNTLLFAVFAAGFFHPRTKRDWRAMGAYSAFLVVLFTEMYGIPLTIYLLGSRLGNRFPLLKDTHAGGHLWNDLTNWQGDPHPSPFHLAGHVALGSGFWLIAAAWKRLHEAARHDELAATGPYAWVRHPQYVGFLLIMIGFLLQWPTIPTLIMFPVLVYVYARLAHSEEREVAKEFGERWDAYAARTPAFLPRHRPVRSTTPPPGPHPAPGQQPQPPRHGRLPPPPHREEPMTGIPVALHPAIADSALAEIMLLLTVLAPAERHRRPPLPGRR